MKAKLEQAFGADPPAGEWFVRLLHGSLVANEVGGYRSFAEIGIESLLTVAAKRGLAMRGEDAEAIVSTMESLPPHPDVYNAMERLFDAGFNMIALTNGSTKTANAQIENAGLHIFLQRVISVEEVGLFKPAAEVYVHAARSMEVKIADTMLVASHDWDCAGAMATGGQAAFIRRPGVVWSLPSRPPPLVVNDLAGLAAALCD
jgi:2-haloacid dehalogenase